MFHNDSEAMVYGWKFIQEWFDIVNLGINPNAWRRHQMETVSALLDLCAGNSPVTGEFPSQRPVTRSFGVLILWSEPEQTIE